MVASKVHKSRLFYCRAFKQPKAAGVVEAAGNGEIVSMRFHETTDALMPCMVVDTVAKTDNWHYVWAHIELARTCNILG